jgi:hypothetical protein
LYGRGLQILIDLALGKLKHGTKEEMLHDLQRAHYALYGLFDGILSHLPQILGTFGYTSHEKITSSIYMYTGPGQNAFFCAPTTWWQNAISESLQTPAYLLASLTSVQEPKSRILPEDNGPPIVALEGFAPLSARGLSVIMQWAAGTYHEEDQTVALEDVLLATISASNWNEMYRAQLGRYLANAGAEDIDLSNYQAIFTLDGQQHKVVCRQSGELPWDYVVNTDRGLLVSNLLTALNTIRFTPSILSDAHLPLNSTAGYV